MWCLWCVDTDGRVEDTTYRQGLQLVLCGAYGVLIQMEDWKTTYRQGLQLVLCGAYGVLIQMEDWKTQHIGRGYSQSCVVLMVC